MQPAARGERLVHLTLFPPSARWTLDGRLLSEENVQDIPLPIGSTHEVVASTLPNNPCCETPFTRTFTVDEGMVSSTFARSSLLAGLLLLVLGSWQLWRRERA